MLSSNAYLAIAVFLCAYAIIVSEKIHRTKVALMGAVIVLLVKIMPQEEAIKAIDFNTIGLLVAMMIIVAITSQTGLFQFLAVKTAKAVKGNPARIMIAFFVFTAVASALLDNVTTVVLLTSITFAITDILEINPIPFLIAEILASNIGGTATLIGDPPNIMIGGATGLTFNDFLVNLFVPVTISAIATCWLLYLYYRKDIIVAPEKQLAIMEMDENAFLTNHKLLVKSICVLGITIVGFLAHGALGFESATIALAGAATLLLISGLEPEEAFHQVEWNTIFFFVGLFILVGGLDVTGVIKVIAEWTLGITHGNVVLMNFVVLWLSALASAFIDNIPFVATMIPLIKALAEVGGMDISTLWWTLSLGACFGGNGTIIGASANVVVASIAAAHGRPISFMYYFKVAFPFMILSIVISNIYIYLMYLR
jgi:Na+/H+ antiporter NhaD/arsenite permease-like protein